METRHEEPGAPALRGTLRAAERRPLEPQRALKSAKRSVSHPARSCRSAAAVTCAMRQALQALQALQAPCAPCATPPPPYRVRLPHADGRADGRRLALPPPLHLLHHSVAVASREAVEQHRRRRGGDVVNVLLGSASQDVHQRLRRERCAVARRSHNVALI